MTRAVDWFISRMCTIFPLCAEADEILSRIIIDVSTMYLTCVQTVMPYLLPIMLEACLRYLLKLSGPYSGLCLALLDSEAFGQHVQTNSGQSRVNIAGRPFSAGSNGAGRL